MRPILIAAILLACSNRVLSSDLPSFLSEDGVSFSVFGKNIEVRGICKTTIYPQPENYRIRVFCREKDASDFVVIVFTSPEKCSLETLWPTEKAKIMYSYVASNIEYTEVLIANESVISPTFARLIIDGELCMRTSSTSEGLVQEVTSDVWK